MRGATLEKSDLQRFLDISIHAPHAGSDFASTVTAELAKFQSTLPMRGATYEYRHSFKGAAISIHAPHAGSDCFFMIFSLPFLYFNPRSPCGERL